MWTFEAMVAVMSYVQGSRSILERTTWNGSHGNKLLNLFAVAKFAELHKLYPILPEFYSSPFVEFSDIWIVDPKRSDVQIIEDHDPFDLGSLLNLAVRTTGRFCNFVRFVSANIKRGEAHTALSFLQEPEFPVELEGYFFDARYQIDQLIFEKYFIPTYPQSNLNLSQNVVLHDNVCIVHVRGSDFKEHLKWAYPSSICLPREYYLEAFNAINDIANNSVEFWVVSDDVPYAETLLKGLDCNFVTQSSSVADWHLLRRCNYRIESNSSFCWTAASCNSKTKSVYPRFGYGKLGEVQYPLNFRNATENAISLEYPQN